MYKIGDKVKIKTWDEMEEKYGLNCGFIDVPFGFMESMKNLCGSIGVLTSSTPTSTGTRYKISFKGEVSGYNFSEEMFVLYEGSLKKLLISKNEKVKERQL